MKNRILVLFFFVSLNSFSQDSILIENTIKQLHLNRSNIKNKLVVSKARPNTNETIIVIPEIVDEGEENFELNSHILIVNNNTGKIIYKFFESYKTNNWVSDALKLTKITIDTAPYNVTDSYRAFGVRVFYYGSSRVNPYINETLSLYIVKDNSLKKILHNYDVKRYIGAWNSDCDGEFIEQNKILIISDKKTNDYFDIRIKNKITETINFEDESGECDYSENISREQEILKFNGEKYEKQCMFLPLKVYINDALGQNGTNIRKQPNGKVLLKLNQQNDYFTLTIIEVNNGWYKVVKIIGIEDNVIEIPGGNGWVHNSVIEIATRKNIELLNTPITGTIVGQVDQEIGVRIIDKCLGWVQIEFNGMLGWVESKWLCGNPVTTCP